MGLYNIFMQHRFPLEDDAEVVYYFEGKVFECRMDFARFVAGNIDALRVDAHAGAIANLDLPYRHIYKSFAAYIRNHSSASHADLRTICYEMIGYIAEHFGYPYREGVEACDTYVASDADIAAWRRDATLPVHESLAWLTPHIAQTPILGYRSTLMLSVVCITQLFDPLHPCFIDLDEMGPSALTLARMIQFGTCTRNTLAFLRNHAKTGLVYPTQIVSIFTAVGEENRFSFFFLCSAHPGDACKHEDVMHLIHSTAQAVSTLLLQPGVVVPLVESTPRHGFLPHDNSGFYYHSLHATKGVKVTERRIRRLAPNDTHLSIIRYNRPFYGLP
jgi:hypothetical protein